MKCPRCQSTIAATPDATGSLTCPGCGARLRSRSAATAPGVASRPAPAPGLDPAPAPRYPDGRNPNATLPPGTPLPRIPRPSDLRATPLTDMPAKRDAAARAPQPATPPGAAEDRTATSRMLETALAELKALRAGQERILALLGRPPEAASSGPPSLGLHLDDAPFGGVPEVRARRRKSVLLVDDDPGTRAAALAALEAAEVPVRTATEGNAALAAIAEDKPDVIVMELDIGGSMPGKDVINLIKATMEWVDVPILLYTRMAIQSQKEARTIHGADEFVLKQAGPEALVSRVIAAFRAH